MITFDKEPIVIMKEILALPFEEQGQWVDLWLEQPEVVRGLERKARELRESRLVHPKPINRNRPDSQWEE